MPEETTVQTSPVLTELVEQREQMIAEVRWLLEEHHEEVAFPKIDGIYGNDSDVWNGTERFLRFVLFYLNRERDIYGGNITPGHADAYRRTDEYEKANWNWKTDGGE